MGFSAETEAAIAAAVVKRDAAVEVRTAAAADADAAAAANAASKESEVQRITAFKEADTAKREAVAAVDKELSIPAPEAPPRPAAPIVASGVAKRK